MDDYRKNVIELVRGRPLLWDPTNPDYKNKDQRKQVWDEIDGQLKPPAGSNVNAKATWDQMSRRFSNALRRKDKRSGSGAGNDKEWKLEKDMMFLLPVKQLRNTSNNLPETAVDMPVNYEDCQDSPQSQPYTEMENSREGVNNETAIETGQENMNAYRPHLQKKRKRAETNEDDTSTIINMMKQRQMDKMNESPRLNFFRSLMPTIDSFHEDQFMNLQIDVIQAVRKQKHARHLLTHHYQPPSQSSESSADSYYSYSATSLPGSFIDHGQGADSHILNK